MSSRPVSPHMQIYRPQLTSVMSITHRITGIALSAGAVVLTYWLLALAAGEASHATARGLLGSIPGLGLLAVWAFSFYYHLFNGIRHLLWDAGVGFEMATVYRSGYAALAASAILSIATIGYAVSRGGAA